jgi:26S proteasome regulatory subunit N2
LVEYSEAVDYALESGPYFNLNTRDQYTDTLVGKCIDRYITQRQKNYEAKDPADKVEINKKLENVIEKIFERSITEKEFRMGLGVALDSRRTDKIEKILAEDQYSSEVLDYLTKTILTSVKSRAFRIEALKIVVAAFGKREKNFSDFVNLAQALFLLGEHKTCAELLAELVRNDDQVTRKFLALNF